jgi:predicted ArsR family transcriptional regulator
MANPSEKPAAPMSDVTILDLLRKQGAMSVGQLAVATHVTATAVRQRLNRLMSESLVERVAVRYGRGRPRHGYSLTEKGRRQTGSNFADLAIALWNEIREIKDADVRRGLLQRLAKRMAAVYAGRVTGDTLDERMQSLGRLFDERDVEFAVDRRNQLPVLQARECPYPELAEHDRTVCSMERMLFSELLGESVRLSECRLDGGACCTFETAGSFETN